MKPLQGLKKDRDPIKTALQSIETPQNKPSRKDRGMGCPVISGLFLLREGPLHVSVLKLILLGRFLKFQDAQVPHFFSV